MPNATSDPPRASRRRLFTVLPFTAVPLTLLSFVLALALSGGVQAQAIVVSAASSLTESFLELATMFEDRNDGVRVDLNLAGSSTLAAQIVQGAPVSVFASANDVQMNVVVSEGLIEGAPRVFARNRLVVITPPGSPVRTAQDLATDGVTLVLAGPEVPVGAYARAALSAMDVVYGEGFERAALANVVSEEPNARLVAAKIGLGTADAAIVYATDAMAVDGVETIRIADQVNVLADYPVAALADAPHPAVARAFVAFVLSPEARAVLASHGFEAGD